jgi:hypothetical protein
MSEFNIESESIDVERIMAQIRDRLRAKRGEDYTEEQIRELATTKLERFLDPKNVKSGMVQDYQKRLKEKEAALRETPQPPPSFEFDTDSIYRSSRGLPGQILFRIRKLMSPFLKFFFNLAPIVHALKVQQQINERLAKVISQMVRTQAEFIEIAALNYEVMNNLVVEMTRLSIEMKNHRMRVESVAGRLDFDERRARSREKVVQPRDDRTAPAQTNGDITSDVKPRRRRRGRRRPSGAVPLANEEASSSRPPREMPPPHNGSDVANSELPTRTEPDRPPVATASSPAESHSLPAPSHSVSGEPRQRKNQTSTTPPTASPLPGASAPPADNTRPVSNGPATSAGETDPSKR